MEQTSTIFSLTNFLLFASFLYLAFYPILVFITLKDEMPGGLPFHLNDTRKKLSIEANIAYICCLLIVIFLSEPTRSWREQYMPYLTTLRIVTKTNQVPQSMEEKLRISWNFSDVNFSPRIETEYDGIPNFPNSWYENRMKMANPSELKKFIFYLNDYEEAISKCENRTNYPTRSEFNSAKKVRKHINSGQLILVQDIINTSNSLASCFKALRENESQLLALK